MNEQQAIIKPFPSAPNKLKNYIFKHLTKSYQITQLEDFLPKYEYFMYEFSKRIHDAKQVERMETRIEEFIVDYEIKDYERMIVSKEWTIQKVESDIRIGLEYDDFFTEQVGYKLLMYVDEWKRKYGEPNKEWTEFSNDRQNVHTTVVSQRMNESLEILLATPVPPTQKTIDEITTAFANDIQTNSQALNDVYKDMKQWGQVSEIFQKGDYLYRRTLRGLWAKLKTYKEGLRKELLQRLWEECSEAVGLCATGHISRLTNVLVGFDEKFQPQVSIQETFQNSMVAISQSSLPLDKKIEQAKKVMEDMNIPIQERQDWLDAL